jgi:predicted HTH domain antitoxin/predicted RNase H-like HicB family nuclease
MPTVSFDLPDEVFSALRRSPEEFVRALRLAAAIHWYERGEISQEKAARIAGLDRTDFLLALAREQADAFVVDLDDLKREFDRGRKDWAMQSFTCFVKKEGHQYASLCLELDVASCGRTKKEAIEGLKNAIEAYLEFMTSEGREQDIYRPVPMHQLRDFLFTEDEVSEQSVKALTLEFEYA